MLFRSAVLGAVLLLCSFVACFPIAPNVTLPPYQVSANITFNANTTFLFSQYYMGIPHSYFVPEGYWYSPQYLPSYLHPNPLTNQSSILDRTLTQYGLNLYDAATWEIALALSGEFELQDTYEFSILGTSSTGCDTNVGGLCDIRGDTSDFLYGSSQTPGSALPTVPMPSDSNKTISGAFFFRMIGASYTTTDPILGNYSPSFRYPYPCASCETWNIYGIIVWDDWKPITGENVWGLIIGPIQTLYIKYNGALPTWTGYDDAPLAIKLASSIMPALKAMQSPMGSLYHCPAGSDIIPPDPIEGSNVSNENNISGFSAIEMFLYVLQNNTVNAAGSDFAATINDLTSLANGLKGWFTNYALAPPLEDGSRVFYQGGHVAFSGGFNPVPIAEYGGFAVDCQTWVSAVLGADFIDNTIAKQLGTAYNIWQQTKTFSAYYMPDGSLGGVGYTVHPEHEIWTAEWTFGAILMTRNLATGYTAMGCSQCSEWAASLLADSEEMTNNLVKSVDDGGMFDTNTSSFLYCNHRYKIPWGWYANPIPALCASAWGIMNEQQFDPFVLGGKYTQNYFTQI